MSCGTAYVKNPVTGECVMIISLVKGFDYFWRTTAATVAPFCFLFSLWMFGIALFIRRKSIKYGNEMYYLRSGAFWAAMMQSIGMFSAGVSYVDPLSLLDLYDKYVNTFFYAIALGSIPLSTVMICAHMNDIVLVQKFKQIVMGRRYLGITRWIMMAVGFLCTIGMAIMVIYCVVMNEKAGKVSPQKLAESIALTRKIVGNTLYTMHAIVMVAILLTVPTAIATFNKRLAKRNTQSKLTKNDISLRQTVKSLLYWGIAIFVSSAVFVTRYATRVEFSNDKGLFDTTHKEIDQMVLNFMIVGFTGLFFEFTHERFYPGECTYPGGEIMRAIRNILRTCSVNIKEDADFPKNYHYELKNNSKSGSRTKTEDISVHTDEIV